MSCTEQKRGGLVTSCLLPASLLLASLAAIISAVIEVLTHRVQADIREEILIVAHRRRPKGNGCCSPYSKRSTRGTLGYSPLQPKNSGTQLPLVSVNTRRCCLVTVLHAAVGALVFTRTRTATCKLFMRDPFRGALQTFASHCLSACCSANVS